MLRIPAWPKRATINGNESAKSGAFHETRRRWSAGDVVELTLDMPARMIEANPYVEEARNHIAVMRGPIVYCLESPDLPPDVRLMDITLSRSAQLTARQTKDLLGVTVIHCPALARPTGEWFGTLYRDAVDTPAKKIDLTLIPYYAWDNRGPSEMTVWIPATG